jgi:hypothetical protein
MRQTLVHAFAVGFLLACSGGGGGGGGPIGSTTLPQQEAHVSASSGVEVTATITAATLGEECGGSGGAGGFAPSQGDCAAESRGGCGGGCQPSNVQINFTASAGGASAKIAIVSVKLVEADGEAVVDTLTASQPKSWTGSAYAPWDERVAPSSQLKASYDLTAPTWSTLSSGKTTASYSTKYRLHVTIRIDGTEVVLTSTDLTREPSVVT